MAPEEVWCGVHGVPSEFPIEIERSATVRELQEAIYRHERFDQVFQGANAFTPDELALFHARDINGVWVPEDEKLDQFLEGEVDRSLYRMLNPAWQLQDKACFGTDPEGLPDKVIHVLVELPFGDGDDDGSDDDAPQTRTYAHSRVDSSDGREIMEYLGIRMEEVATVPTSRTARARVTEALKIEQDGEVELTKTQRRAQYQSYVETNLKDALKAAKLCVVGIPEDLKVLTIGVGNIKFAGQPDLLIMSRTAKRIPSNIKWLTNVRMLIQVRPANEPSADAQGLTELVALDLLAKKPVVALVTDLDKSWRFYWIAGIGEESALVHKAVFTNPGDAFQAIQALLVLPKRREDAVSVPVLAEPVKRAKLSYLTPICGDPAAVAAAIERYHDIASVLGPDFDMALEVGRLMVQTIPAFQFNSR